MMENKNIDNFPMMSINNNNFDMFNEIKKDKYIIYGEDEIKYITNLKYKKQFLDKNLKEIRSILDRYDNKVVWLSGKKDVEKIIKVVWWISVCRIKEIEV